MDDRLITKRFLMGESYESPSIHSWIRAVYEIAHRITPRTIREQHDLALLKQHLKELRRSAKRLTEENRELHERVTLLEEGV